jgi:hypothetical protein
MWSMAKHLNHYAVAFSYLWDAGPWMAVGFLGLVGSLAVITSGNGQLSAPQTVKEASRTSGIST